MTIPDERNQNELELMNETMSFSIRNISNNLESEIDDLRETIITEVGLQLANLTSELNALKEKQNELIDLGDDHDRLLDVLSITFFEKYATYVDTTKNESLHVLARKNMTAFNLTQFADDRLHDTLSLKLHPIDDNLNKV